ncbi:MAG: hypothetical protein NMK33_03575 [Candidatus Cardinium sp.]|uniref:hypothetical protein n=1 Tax=Cardinium endosymbiont of Dermatophagoides farinae TaxID=2597823 RepID=UPI001183C77F|nr:hypothetical protein [Cardinium endosymbiont of Dermatophagoides farinae]TSJ80541.1 hypothetical protein FPG78_00345 [Cardinium endosymbiont of Dermatophagoides farinae]UWW96514.1 MAG: hypothetical protein NMK33_03575 [Candidatus Cardinium sp.]
MSLYPIALFYDSIQNEQYFQIGSFKKPIGIDGGLVASFLYPFNHTELVKLPALFVEIDAIKVPYSIKNIISTEQKTIVHLNLIQSKTAAYALRNLPLFLPITLKPKWVQATLPYSLVDGLVEEVVLGQLGKIEAIYCMRDQYMMAVNYLAKELLIPYCKPFLIHVDEMQKKVTIQLPEGYLEAML